MKGCHIWAIYSENIIKPTIFHTFGGCFRRIKTTAGEGGNVAKRHGANAGRNLRNRFADRLHGTFHVTKT